MNASGSVSGARPSWFDARRAAATLVIFVLAGPVIAGLLGTLAPAFGYLPALGGTTVSIDPFRRLFAQPGIGSSAFLSLTAALVTALVSTVLVALFVASAHGTRAFAFVQHLLSPLLSVPHAAAALGLTFLIAPSGMAFRLIATLTGMDRPPDLLIVGDPLGLAMMAGLIAKELPFLLLMTLAALPQLPIEQTARLGASLGFGRVASFLYLGWPGIYRQIRLPIFAIIAFSSSVVDIATILGPSAPPTLAVRLVQWASDPDLALRFVASAGALLQLVVTLAAIGIWIGLERLGGALLSSLRSRGIRFVRDAVMRGVVIGIVALSALAVSAALALLVMWSFAGFWQFPDLAPDAFTLRNWQRIGPRLLDPIGATFVIGASASAIACLLVITWLQVSATGSGRAAAKAERTVFLLYLPLIIPQAGFLFGLQFLAISLAVDATLPSLIAVHLVFVLPYVMIALSDPWHALDPRYEMTARSLGISNLSTFLRVRLPLMTRPILTALALGFAVSVGLYLPTLLIGAGRITTITTEAVALASGSNRRVIGVAATLQLLLPFIGFVLAATLSAILFRNRRDMRP